MGRETVKDLEMVVDSCWGISRELSESAYRRARKREGRKEIVEVGNSAEYN